MDNRFEQLTKLAYKEMDIDPSVFAPKGKAMDIFSLLKIKPIYGKNNKRVLTPYEILGVPPQFDLAGNEVPIVFAIKNKTSKVAKLEEDNYNFVYKDRNEKFEQSIIDDLKFNYKKALFEGNDSVAEMFFNLLNDASGGKAAEILGNFFDYTKYYKKLKRQLLIDIFSHFFLLYISKRKAFKKGLLKKNKIFKAYKLKNKSDEKDEYELSAENLLPDLGFQNPELDVIQSIKITSADEYEDLNIETVPRAKSDADKVENKTNISEIKKNDDQKQNVAKGLIGNLISRINQKIVDGKMKIKAHHMIEKSQENCSAVQDNVLNCEEKKQEQENKILI